ncbi:hypothetical protein CRE_23179 [Caenorhabditis remanei]|uniref:Uncharacterized protein n=1 Tax=Caenorhabditis remanei TaxID=31234 RepID=E3NJ53_CAERE|nr:hypothetical protein CRE_23179 [Caenorhabditis remanei]
MNQHLNQSQQRPNNTGRGGRNNNRNFNSNLHRGDLDFGDFRQNNRDSMSRIDENRFGNQGSRDPNYRDYSPQRNSHGARDQGQSDRWCPYDQDNRRSYSPSRNSDWHPNVFENDGGQRSSRTHYGDYDQGQCNSYSSSWQYGNESSVRTYEDDSRRNNNYHSPPRNQDRCRSPDHYHSNYPSGGFGGPDYYDGQKRFENGNQGSYSPDPNPSNWQYDERGRSTRNSWSPPQNWNNQQSIRSLSPQGPSTSRPYDDRSRYHSPSPRYQYDNSPYNQQRRQSQSPQKNHRSHSVEPKVPFSGFQQPVAPLQNERRTESPYPKEREQEKPEDVKKEPEEKEEEEEPIDEEERRELFAALIREEPKRRIC